YSQYLDSFDTVFALNVIEHIEDDIRAVANCKSLLRRNGTLIILVPSYSFLFNRFDKELGHHRRYNIPHLKNLFIRNDLEIIHSQHFNFAGMLGWYFSGNILKKKTIPEGQIKIYNTLVPMFRIIDKLLFNKVGLSTIVVG